ncbi:phosphoethanolamine transferase [Coprobacter tertius]|uniref:Lipid A phosphoethanolamine transferase n=1 Tax=Coprobacter tertius TaxID=2944915 RepID=A0ABT1MJS4_9BACT|nr:phosphoethanolamine transferase [Coprobacter tertius]MCP9612294.1 lipid A phosphoethanolamine transferase [Coprobacter tertius]
MKNRKKNLDRLFFSQWFLYSIFLAILFLPNLFLFFTETTTPLVARFCNIFLPLSVYGWVMTLSPRPGKVFWFLFPVLFLGAFQLVLLYLFGESIIAVDMFLNLFTTNSVEALELLDKLMPAVVGVIVLYIPALVLAAFTWHKGNRLSKSFRYRCRLIWSLTGVAGFVLLAASYVTDDRYSVKTDLYPVNVCYNIFQAFDREMRSDHYYETSRDFSFGSQAEHDEDIPEIYVMVIGETSRAIDWELYGYTRNTNPLLSRENELIVFPYALTQSNTTHKSVPMLLSAASAENFNSLYQQKGIITAFKEAGFYTLFLSNQQPNHSFIDFLGKEADEWNFIKDSPRKDVNAPDEELLKYFDNVLKEEHHKLFVVLHTYGSHFDYRERYPAIFSVYKPDDITGAKPCFRNNLINAYDNTIRYTDYFLTSLIDRLRRSGKTSAVLYTSDHGEDIFDDRRKLFLHASPVPSYYQMHVPMLIWLSDSYRYDFPTIKETLDRNKNKGVETSVSFFHTMLTIGGIDTRYRNDSLSLASPLYHERKRLYLNDHNKPCTLDDIGLKKEDFDMFQRMHIVTQ